MMTKPRSIAPLLVVAAAVASAVAVFAQARATVTLEDLLSAPFPTSLTAAPVGGQVAWVFNAKGVRNIWVAGPPEYVGRPITTYTEDDGQELSDLTWTPDGRFIVYVRGGGPNRQGEVPNPTSDPGGAEQAVWVVAATGGTPRRLGEGSSPEVSPRGDRVAFVHRGQAWWAPLDGRAAAAPLFKARGQTGSLRWSPDGTRLAFVSTRGDHSFVGVYEIDSRRVRFLDPGLDRDTRPVWSPDGRRLAFVRIPASRQFFSFGPQREAEPWSLRVAEVDTGRGVELWRAERGRGSVFQGVSGRDQVLWGAGDRLVFPWERTGWKLLYAVPVPPLGATSPRATAPAGPRATLLTPGEFEVEEVALTPDRSAVVYSSNQGDPDRRHLWRVPVGGGAPVALTSGRGIEWAPTPTADGGAIAFFRSDARRPAHPAILVDGRPPRELAPGAIPASFPTDALVEPQAVTITAADGMTIPAQLFVPKTIPPGERRPAVVFFHGGSRRQMLLGWHYLAYYHNAYALNQYLVSRGFVVLSVNYRSGIGYGLEFREALDYGAHGASEFNDVLGAGLYLRSREDVDPARIGLWGGSYGGYLTALGLAKASDLFAAGVDVHGVHDWNVVIRNFTPSYDPEARQDLARRAFDSSPMAHLSRWKSPVLLVHGDDDRNVPFSESVDLAAELRRRGVEVEQLVLPDEVHSFLRHESWLRVFRAAAEFLERRLGRPAPATAGGR
jgi:dipeptidyl aminopeptidase/acylaminoacyl peptidase